LTATDEVVSYEGSVYPNEYMTSIREHR